MNAWVIPKVIAIVPLSAYFAFARIEMANAYYGDLKGGSDQAALAAVSGGGQVVTALRDAAAAQEATPP